MFIRKYWIPLSVFIVAIASVGFYMLTTQTPKEPIKTDKPVEVEKPKETEAPIGDPSQGGHVHDDGTGHAAPHTPVPPSVEVKDPASIRPL